MDVLLIDGDCLRRVDVARHLANAGHRLTIASSIAEARDILQFVEEHPTAPDVVAIEDILLTGDTSDFRNEIGDRFPGMLWFPLRPDPNLRWLTDRLRKESSLKTTGHSGLSWRRNWTSAGKSGMR